MALALSRPEAIEQLWIHGNLTYLLRPEQRYFKSQIKHSGVDLVVGNISRRWGKSFSLVTYCIEECLKNPKEHIRYGCAFSTDLEEFILPAFEIILNDCPEYLRPYYHKSKKRWVFRNGSVIKLIGLDRNPNGLRGNAITKIVIDEAGFVSHLKYIYNSVIIPATMKQSGIKLIFISTPPESPEHFFVELISMAKILDSGFYLELTIDDISDLEEDEKNRILFAVGGRESAIAKREFFCKIIVDPQRAIAPSFQDEIHVAEYEPEYVSWSMFGDTGGVRDLTVFHKGGWCHKLKKNVILDELWFPSKTPTSKIVTGFKEKFGSDMTLTMDAPGQLQIDYSNAGLPAHAPIKDEFASSLMLIDNSFYRGETIIHPRCKLLIQTLKNHLLNKHRTDFERSEITGHADAVMSYCYALRSIDKVTDLRPKPKPSEIFINPNAVRDPMAHELKKLGVL